MPRYMVERTFPEGLRIPTTPEGAQLCVSLVATNAEEGVTWVQSFVTDDKCKSFCVYDAPDPESIRRVAQRNGLPVDQIMSVRVLDPYFFS